MARKKHLINVHTSTGTTEPSGATLYLGEIAVQHTPGDPALWIKVGSGETSNVYEKFIGKTEITNMLNASNILGSAYTFSGLSYVNSSTTIADAYSALTQEMLNDERVVSAAMNQLNNRVNEVSGVVESYEGRIYDLETGRTTEYMELTNYEISCGTTEEELLLTDEDTINEAFGKIQKQILDNEEAIAAGLNDLSRRIDENTGVTILSGVVQTNQQNIQQLSGAVQTNQQNIQQLSSATQSLSSATQSLSASVMSISAKTSGVLTVNLNGVQQGQYSPSANTTIDITAIQDVTGADVLLTGYELSSGRTQEELIVRATDTVNEAFGKIQKQNIDNEAVISGALNNLNDRISSLETISGQTDELSGSVVTNKSNISTLSAASANFFNGAEYVSSAKTIIFTNGGVVKDSIDATDFIKDGMVSSVTISGSDMVITFNTDAGHEDIVLALTDIFEPNNYYTKTDINTGVSAVTELLSAETTAHISDTTIHITAEERTRWQDGWMSGVSAYTKVEELSAATTALSETVTAISGSVDWLSAVVIDNEYIVAMSYNDLNDRINSANTDFASVSSTLNSHVSNNGIHVTSGEKAAWTNGANYGTSAYTSVTALSAATMAHTADTTVHIANEERSKWDDAWTSGVSAYTMVEAVSAATSALSQSLQAFSAAYCDDEYVISLALNSLNDRVNSLSGETTGMSVDVITLSGAAHSKITSLSAATTAISANSANYFDAAEYISSAKTIIFTNGGVTKASVDATAFIKDGMVDTVVIDTPSAGTHSGASCLIVTFNTDAGKEDIEIPLSDIFDPDNYYTTAQTIANFLSSAATLDDVPDGSGRSLSNYVWGNAKIFAGTCATAGATSAKTVDCEAFTEDDLVKGALLFVTFDNTNSAAVANLRMDVNETGLKPIKKIYTTGTPANLTAAGEIRANQTYLFEYDGTNWVCMTLDYYASNTDTQAYRIRYYNLQRVCTSQMYRYRLMFSSADEKYWVPANNTSQTGATSVRAATTTPIDPFGPIGVFWATATTVNSGASPTTGTVYTKTSAVTLGYSFVFANSAMTAKLPVFLKCAPQADGSAIIDATTPIVQELPSTEDGKIYIFLGVAQNETAFELYENHPVYEYKNGHVRQYQEGGAPTLGPSYTYSGIPYVNSATSIADAYSALTNEVILNERTVSVALNDLDEQTEDLSGSVVTIKNITTAHTGNTEIHLPAVTSSDNGKILQVVNGVWTAVDPVTVYNGAASPLDSFGNDGDIYLQY